MRTLLLLFVLLVCAAGFADERAVTLDVKDEDVRVILKSMQQQCGIKNLIIDKEVAGKGMIYFNDVPCANAFKVVFMQFGLTGQIDSTVVVVEPRPR
ncbi:MAG TPA: hypothetical protein VEK79_25015 [Thermoanaerobaculia bacterium]|nr:hypothetical protein [Thermoanaerobaculia bacterium]